MDCGPTCLRMIAKYYGRLISIEKLRRLCETNKIGSSMNGLTNAAEKIGFRTLAVKINFVNLIENAPLPCIVHWNEKHFVVVYKVKKNKIYVADPAHGTLTFSTREFLDNWIGKYSNEDTEEGIVLLLEPTPTLNISEETDKQSFNGLSFFARYLKGYGKLVIQLGFGLLAGSILQLIFPFLTQSVVDVGIQNKDIHFLYLILFGQLFIFVGRSSVDIIRSWVLLHLSTRINISLVSDFLIKLMKLPISFFDVKQSGDIMQRIDDHKRIEFLLTSQTLNVLFSAFNFVVFGIVLSIYSIPVFLIFLLGTSIYFAWISFFMKKRRDLDHKQFSQMGSETGKVMELIAGMQEIKLHNAERRKRWSWEFVQIRLFKIKIKGLKLEQIQSNGSSIINECKNIFISFFTAKLVIDGQLTLGMMLSVSYIIGQLNAPISQFLQFLFSFQNARISLERVAEIHNLEDEESLQSNKLDELPVEKSIAFNDVNFKYEGFPNSVLKNINFTIEANKTTAIVGASGSGKTTLMKLLLRFYEINSGTIKIGKTDINDISNYVWREASGAVMQEGYIFNDTIANNIAISDDIIDKERLKNAIRIANIEDFIEDLPLKLNTQIGSDGVGLSGGQRQRILIARAVYKNPLYLFFDEATSALDANNEKIIMNNLDEFFKGRTAVVIAHRLSTVMNADKIVVLEKGEIIEEGTHSELIELKGSYFNLVKNQLALEKIESLQNNIQL